MTETQQHTPSAVAMRIAERFCIRACYRLMLARIVDEELAAQQERVRDLVLKARELDSWLLPLLSDAGHRKQREFRKALDAFKEVQ